MTFQEKNLVRQAISSTEETVYTLSEGITVLKDIHICNNSTTNCQFSMWIVATGGSATNENIMFFAEIGPSFDFLLKATMNIAETKESITDEYYRFDLNLDVGIGSLIKIGSGGLILDVRYNYGILDIATSSYYEAVNRSYTFTIGYLFGRKIKS